jgi:hypothetical protein
MECATAALPALVEAGSGGGGDGCGSCELVVGMFPRSADKGDTPSSGIVQ